MNYLGLSSVLTIVCACAGSASVNFEGDGTGVVIGERECRSSCKVGGHLAAVADEHSKFGGWSGGCSGFGECQPNGKDVTVTFTAVDFPVRVKTLGSGRVTTSDGAVVDVRVWVPRDTRAALIAVADPGWTFVRWEPLCAAEPTRGTCEVLVDKAMEVTAVFEKTLTVTVVVDGPGVVVGPPGIGTCTGTCAAEVRSGTTMALSARPRQNATFTAWTNGCFQTADCSVTVTTPITITGRFHDDLSVSTIGDGLGTLAGLPGCSTGSCSVPWGREPSYSFTATPAENSRFVRFVNCPSPTGSTCLVDRYVPSIQVEFDYITSNPVLVDGPFSDGRVIATSPASEFVWLHYYAGRAPVRVNGASSPDAGEYADRWMVFRNGSGGARFITEVADGRRVQPVAQLDGGMVVRVPRGASWTWPLAGRTFAEADDVIASFNQAGALEWADAIDAFAVDTAHIETDPMTGQVYVGGAVGPQGTPVTFGSTTVTAADAGVLKQTFVASYSRSGQRQWIARGAVTDILSTPVFYASSTGPRMLEWIDGSGGPCVPTWAPTATETHAFSRWRLDRQGQCLPGSTVVPVPTGTYWSFASGVETSRGSFLSMNSSGALPWSPITTIPDALYTFILDDGVNEPRHAAPDCEFAPLRVFARTSDTVLVAGVGRCVPWIGTVATAEHPVVFVFDLTTMRAVSGLEFDRTQWVDAAAVGPRELRLFLSFSAPARIAGVDYPISGLGEVQRGLLLTVRP